jgi:tetratricopeptide (TPR) repeat protein
VFNGRKNGGTVFRFPLAATASALLATTALGQAHVHPQGGHVGSVHFETSCSPAATPVFDNAVAWLHSFEFAQAINGFEQALALDPDCAMAHWGIALSSWSNPMSVAGRSQQVLTRGQGAVDKAITASRRNGTQREKDYIAAVAELFKDHSRVRQADRVAAYERAMSALADNYPDDTEARIFHAISLVAAASPSDKTYANQRRAGAILESLWEKQPEHPGLAHYIIHTYDYPPLAGEASTAALRYASIAPSAAHALHMPSHIFTRTGQWRESIATNLRSRAIAEGSNSIAEALHALDYAVYAYLQLGRYADAKRIIDTLPALAARFDVNAVTGAAPGSAGVFALAAMPSRYALERGAWAEAAALEPMRSDFAWTDAITLFARALGSARTGKTAPARAAIDSLSGIAARLSAVGEAYWSEQVAIQHLAARAWLDLAEGRTDSAVARMREAVAREDATEKSAVTPGPLAPARELLGDMLLELGRPREALAEYQRTLLKEPNRYRTMSGAIRAAEAAGDRQAAAALRASLDAMLRETS